MLRCKNQELKSWESQIRRSQPWSTFEGWDLGVVVLPVPRRRRLSAIYLIFFAPPDLLGAPPRFGAFGGRAVTARVHQDGVVGGLLSGLSSMVCGERGVDEANPRVIVVTVPSLYLVYIYLVYIYLPSTQSIPSLGCLTLDQISRTVKRSFHNGPAFPHTGTKPYRDGHGHGMCPLLRFPHWSCWSTILKLEV
jgi:hypothetical protein